MIYECSLFGVVAAPQLRALLDRCVTVCARFDSPVNELMTVYGRDAAPGVQGELRVEQDLVRNRTALRQSIKSVTGALALACVRVLCASVLVCISYWIAEQNRREFFVPSFLRP